MTGNPGSKFAHHAESPALPATRGSRLLLYRCAEAFGYMQEQRQRGGARTQNRFEILQYRIEGDGVLIVVNYELFHAGSGFPTRC